MSVTVTVYKVEVAGPALTTALLLALNPVAGLQRYLLPPVAVNVVESPKQMGFLAGVMLGLGSALTVTIMESLRKQVSAPRE